MVRILLAQRLAEKGWTQKDLSIKTGIRPTTIGEYYNELAERVRFDHLERICEALDCDVADLLTNEYDRIRQRERAARHQRKKSGGAV